MEQPYGRCKEHLAPYIHTYTLSSVLLSSNIQNMKVRTMVHSMLLWKHLVRLDRSIVYRRRNTLRGAVCVWCLYLHLSISVAWVRIGPHQQTKQYGMGMPCIEVSLHNSDHRGGHVRETYAQQLYPPGVRLHKQMFLKRLICRSRKHFHGRSRGFHKFVS